MDVKNLELMKTILTSDWETGHPDLKGYEIHCVKDRHILCDLAENKKWRTPYILVSKAFKSDQVVVDSPVKSQTSDLDESLAGSPLKLQEFRADSFIAAPTQTSSGPVSIFKPLSVNEARSVLSLYSLSSHELLQEYILCDNAFTLLPMWVLCDGRDAEHNVVMATHATQGNNKRYFETTNVTLQGPVFADSKIISREWSKRSSIFKSGKGVSTECSCKYDIHGSRSKDETFAPSAHQGALVVDFHWSRMSSLLQSPPVEAKATVRATVSVGDAQSAAHSMYRELTLLKGLVMGLESGLAKWTSKTEEVPIMITVRNLIQGLEEGKTFPETQDAKKLDDSVFLNAANNLFAAQREELDFTEQLWNILKDCTCFSDLEQCFQYILDCLGKGEIQPMVHRDNRTTLAQLIRDSYHSKMEAPAVDKLLLLLVEIGLDKLSNDYSHVFLSKELVTLDSIEKFIKPEDEVSIRLGGLEKLHHVIELVAMLETLDLPKMNLSISARQALKHYECNEVRNQHTFTVPVQTSSVKSVFQKYQPSVWKATLTAHRDGTETRLVYMFTENPPFNHVNSQQSEIILGEEARPYFLTILTEDNVVL